LAIVSVVLLIGLVASCGKEEPRFKILSSPAYTASTQDSVTNSLYDQYFSKMKRAVNEDNLWLQYRDDVLPLVKQEMNNKNPAYGLMCVVKADKYRIRVRTVWTTKPNFQSYYQVWEN